MNRKLRIAELRREIKNTELTLGPLYRELDELCPVLWSSSRSRAEMFEDAARWFESNEFEWTREDVAAQLRAMKRDLND